METTDSEKPPITDKDQPVVYTADGQPLYSHPSQGQAEEHPHIDHSDEPEDPENLNNNEIIKLKSQRSKEAFPDLNLGENEYVIALFRRHPIGLFIPFLLGIVLIATLMLAIINYDQIIKLLEINIYSVQPASVIFPIILFIFLVVIVLYAIYYVYYNNNVYLTNECVIQRIQTAPFSKRGQTVSLPNIEEASYVQSSIMQQVFNYGSIRLSTLGDEDTYRLTYVMSPREQIDKLNNAVRVASKDRIIKR